MLSLTFVWPWREWIKTDKDKNILSLQRLRENLIHVRPLAAKKILNYCLSVSEIWVFRFCLLQEDVIGGFRRSSVCSIHCPPVPPVCVTTSPQLNTAWAKPCFPFLCGWMVCQNFHGYNHHSFSMASTNSSHSWDFASATTKTAALLASQYLSADSGDPLAWKSSFSLKASFTTGVHQGVLLLLPQRALVTFWQQLLAPSTMNVLNMNPSKSISPTSPKIHKKKFFWKWDLKDPNKRDLAC